nr:family 16 glycosylhydrolase [Methylobacterium sp. 37f]
MSQVGADTVIKLETGETLTLRDHKVEDLSAANFRLPVDLSKYQLTFSDEFNTFSGSATGVATTWQTKYPQAGLRTLPNNKEDEYYSDSSVGVNPFSVKDGVLDITAARATQGVETPLGSGLDWTSGVITTYKSFSQLYGYFEVRAQLPAGKGFWPAFWLLPADLSWPPELDVFEVLGDEPGTIYASTHSKVGGPNVTETQTVFGIDTSKGFHTYGVDWQADTITYYVDNNAVARLATPSDMNKPMYMLLNLAVGDAGSWPGATDATTPAEGHMLIDSVRAYARNPGVVADIQDASPVPGGHDPGGSNASVQAATPSQGLASTSGVPAAEGSHVTAVYRFFDTRTGDHFYTNSTAEKAQILQTLPWFTYEGTPWATPSQGADTIDVFRFFDTGTTAHFFTTSVGERDQIIKTNPSYKYEGVAFEAYADASAPGTVTLERFFNTKTGQHHFAGNAEEAAGINQGAAGAGWIDEGKGFTVHAPSDGMLFA